MNMNMKTELLDKSFSMAFTLQRYYAKVKFLLYKSGGTLQKERRVKAVSYKTISAPF